MKLDQVPRPRDLPPERLAARKEHLLAEIRGATPTSADSLRVAQRARRGRRALPVLATALAAAIVALLLVSPWAGSPSLTDRARAAIGDGPVLHVVTRWSGGFLGPITDIDTGKVVPETRETEVWLDQSRALKRTVDRLGGSVLDDVLETPQGGYTRSGPLITCAWIAAHPVEATKLRVSCNENMENGTTPRTIPETPPTLDPRLADFVDHYRAALDSGRAKEIGRGTIDGRSVMWLRFTWPAAKSSSGAPDSQDVAVDASTYRPVRLRNPDGSWVVDVAAAETLPYSADLFRRPAQAPPQPAGGSTRGREPIELSQAAAVLDRAPLWLGQAWRGLQLAEVERLELSTGYGPLSGIEPKLSNAIRLTYARDPDDVDDGSTIVVSEAGSCELALLWPCGSPVAREGQLQRHMLPGTALARTGGLYLTIQTKGSVADNLTIVRSLTAVGP
jgi:hypothetical protein